MKKNLLYVLITLAAIAAVVVLAPKSGDNLTQTAVPPEAIPANGLPTAADSTAAGGAPQQPVAESQAQSGSDPIAAGQAAVDAAVDAVEKAATGADTPALPPSEGQ